MKQLWTLLAAFLLTSTLALAHEGLHIGDAAPDFKLKNIDGKMYSLAEIKNAKGFIVTFTCNHCPFSVAYEDRLIALHKKYAAKGYPVVAINPNDAVKYPDDSYDKMIERSKQKKFPFLYLHDESQQTARKYGATRTPHMFVLRKVNNELITEYIGAIDDNWEDVSAVKERYVEAAVDELLAGKAVTTSQTKAIGCSIKWKQ